MSDITQQFVRPGPGTTFGPYRLLRELGEGSSSVVFLATPTEGRHDAARTPVALKILRPQHHADAETVARFQRTASLARRAAGPNLCPIEDVGVHEGVPFVAMRFLDGCTLADEIRSRGDATAVDRRARIDLLLQHFEKVALALHHLHARGITHRDVKPSNVIVDAHGEPWLLDFGLLVDSSGDSTVRLAGSLAYLAPELLDGGGQPGVASDLYALGVSLFETITRRLPFRSRTPHDLLTEVLAGQRTTCRRHERAVPTDLDVVIDRLLQARPADRYPSAAAVAEDLRRVRAKLPLALRGASPLTQLGRWLRRNPLPAATLAGLVVILPGLFWLLQDYRRSLRVTELLTAQTMLAAAEREASMLLPAKVGDLPAIERWLRTFDGPGGLRTLRQRVERELAATGARRRASPPDSAEELATELRTVEQMPKWIEALSTRSPVIAAFPALLPAIGRHQREIEARLDAPVPSTTADDLTGVADMLQDLLVALDAATVGAGVVPRMEHERDNLQREREALESGAATWRTAADAVAHGPPYADDVAAGFRLRPQTGLVPLGADPRSGLQEFALLRSGEVPQRGSDGRIVPAAGHAIVFVLMPGAVRPMGATNRPGTPNFDIDAWPEEGPVSSVALHPFLLAKHELTQAQWRRLGGAETAILRAGDRVGGVQITDLHPAEGMSFATAENVLHQNGLSLPTEAQWEYAARRGGFAMPFVGVGNLGRDADGFPLSHAPIGNYPADASGLHDLQGNVAEMVADHFANYDLGVPRPGDGLRLAWRAERVSRGGSFHARPEEARASCRSLLPDFGLLPFVGMRPTCPLETP